VKDEDRVYLRKMPVPAPHRLACRVAAPTVTPSKSVWQQ